MKTAPPAKGGTAAAASETQEAERQPPQHPPGILVWPAVLAPPPASGQENQVIARLTASDSGERATASGHADLPSGQGKMRTLMTRPGAVNRPPTVTVCPVSIQGSRTVTARPRAPTPRAVAVRRPRPPPARAGTRREPSGTTTGVDALDLLTANGKRSENDNHSDVHELLLRDLALLSSHAPRSEEREPWEDNTRWQDYEVSRRGTCGENWGETTKSEARKKRSLQRAGSPHFVRSRRRRRSGSAPQTTDQRHRHPSRSTEIEWEGRKPSQTKNQVHPETPPASPALLRGGKKKKKYQEAKLPKKLPHEGKSEAQKEQSLKGEKTSYAMQELFNKTFLRSRRLKSTKVTKRVTGANITFTPSTSGVGVSIDK